MPREGIFSTVTRKGRLCMRLCVRFLPSVWALLIISAFLASAAYAEKRVALVIGNGTYQKVPTLPNPPNDAADIAGSLQRLGFSVKPVMNAGFDEMASGTARFRSSGR
jgi:hypothetical protein